MNDKIYLTFVSFLAAGVDGGINKLLEIIVESHLVIIGI
jgi:hypothetical protein